MRKLPLIFICLLLFACRKDHITRPTYHYSGTSTPSQFFEPLTWSDYCHVYLANILTSGPDSNATPTVSAAAFFEDTLTYCFDDKHTVKVDGVDLNGKTLPLHGYYYLDTASTITNWMSWHVAGTGSIPTLTLANAGSPPSCPDFYSFPDTMSASVAIVKYLDRLTNVDTGAIFLSDGYSTIGSLFGKKNNKIFFSLSLLGKLRRNTSVELYMICAKNNLVWYGSTRVALSSNHIYKKKIYLLP